MPDTKPVGRPKAFSDDAAPKGVIVDSPHLQIEEAIGQLALLVSRHAKINYPEFPALSHITAGYVSRQTERESVTATRLYEIERERKALLNKA